MKQFTVNRNAGQERHCVGSSYRERIHSSLNYVLALHGYLDVEQCHEKNGIYPKEQRSFHMMFAVNVETQV